MNPVKHYDKFTQKFKGNLFCFFSNLKFTLLNIDLVFTYNKLTKCYSATSKGKERYFFHTKQASRMYSKGLDLRAKDLFDAYLLKHITFKKNDFVIDCGANTGDFLLALPNFINYLGIEPSPLEFECLSKNIAGSSHEAINCGLWDENSSMNFFISSQNADSSFIKPKSYTSIKKIPTIRLDEIIKDKKIKFLKIEGEGAEPEIIRGAKNILRNIEFISADLGFERGVREESTIVPVVNFLLANNFELIDINHKRHIHLFHNKNYK